MTAARYLGLSPVGMGGLWIHAACRPLVLVDGVFGIGAVGNTTTTQARVVMGMHAVLAA
jgi:hypothetical protein